MAFSETLYNIANTEIRMWPWPHLLLKDVFPKKDYEELLSNLPDKKSLSDITKVYPHPGHYRNRFILHDYDNLPEEQRIFWEQTKNKFTNGELKYILLSKIKDIITKLYSKDVLKNHTVFEDTFQLTYDMPGYSLNPHTDANTKIITLIFNLANNSENPEMGTLIINGPDEKVPEEKRIFNLSHHSKFLPNTGVGVVKTFNSWHAVKLTQSERWTIQYTIWAKPKNDT